MSAERPAFIVTSGAGADFSVVGVFRERKEADDLQILYPGAYCFGNELLTVSMSDEEFALFSWLLNPDGLRPPHNSHVFPDSHGH